MPRFREPKVCPGCSTSTAYNKYEGKINGNYITPDAGTIDDLVLMERFDEVSWLCTKCGRSRAVESTVPLFWVYCEKHGKRVSVANDKCILCEKTNPELNVLKKRVKQLRGED